MRIENLQTDILIIGGGTAGCYAGLTIAEKSNQKVLILEKAHIKRSGCLAAGVNALNAYICKGQSPESYTDYAKKDAHGIVREDLLITMSQGLNNVTKKLEALGLVILKDENGDYVERGTRNIKINGENIKPILAAAVESKPNISILNCVNVIDYSVVDGKINGAFALSTKEDILYVIASKAVICATGGAAGIYRPNNPGFSRHKMWYSPFNTGAGFAMGIRAGAEMTTFEMRFIALRCKDTIAPTGTIAQGVGAKQINALGEIYEKKYGLTTSQRLYGTVSENIAGRGPCYLKTSGISEEAQNDLYKAYLNMAPSQSIKWLETKKNPSAYDVEIEGTEPYIVGGHTASGYWVDTNRQTTIKGLYAAGDVAGGCPQKYVTGALAEGEIAALAAIEYSSKNSSRVIECSRVEDKLNDIKKYFDNIDALYGVEELEEAMQTVMDTYAGGIKSNYQFNEASLTIAQQKIEELILLSDKLSAVTMRDLLAIYELKDRLVVATVLIQHMKARKETRWNSFSENMDYKEVDDAYLNYINSIYKNGKIEILQRPLVARGEVYEHKN